MAQNVMNPTRRRFLLFLSASLAAAALSGCSAAPYVRTASPATPISSVSTAQALAALNVMRRNEGLPEVSHNATLQEVANEQAAIMARTGNIAHTAEAGQAFITRLRRHDFWGGAGENLAGGPPTLDAAIDGWMASPSHHKVMVNPDYQQFGLAFRRGSSTEGNTYGTYWVLVMGVTPPAWAGI